MLERSLIKDCLGTIFTKFYYRDTPQFTFKNLSVQQTFSLQRTSSFEECWFHAQQRTIAFEVCKFGLKAGGVFPYIIFKGKSSPISSTLGCTFSFEELMYVWSAIFCSLLRLKVFCQIKGKCSLNAGFFKHKLRRIPLIKLCENGPQTILNERSFQQCIAT